MTREVNMETREHVQTARDFLEAADQEFASGDHLQGSEKLWGAASHAVMAVAQRRGLPFGSHSALKEVVQRLSEDTGDRALIGEFSTAEKFHANFYHDFMEGFQLNADRPVIREFVTRVLALLS
jgi:uncharacterized protein (UPF0332 family)